MVYVIPGLILALLSIILIRTYLFKTRKPVIEECTGVKVDIERAAKNLSGAVKIKTVSMSSTHENTDEEFSKFIVYLNDTYPLVHNNLKREIVNNYSLLYKWNGKNTGRKPILLMAHIDVVPVEEGTERYWKHPPFSGEIAEGRVWGRGTLDVKIQITGIMDAVESLLEKDYVPERDIYIAFGHDEETGGEEGALKIAEILKKRGMDFEFVLDEGGCVTEGLIEDISSPVAVIGTGEKGFADIKLTAESSGGHSSMPPKNTALGIVSKALVALENNQMKTKFTRPVLDMLSYMGPEMKFINRLIIANLWIFGPLFKKVFSSSPSGSALLRTTTATTIARAGSAPNVLPQKAFAIVNFRIIPGEDGNDLLNHINEVTEGLNIKVDILRLENPSKICSIKSGAFKTIERAVYQVFPDALVSPYLVLGGTDARKYEVVCDNIYRFSPYRIAVRDLRKMHGTDENISFDNIGCCIKFYTLIILNS